MTDREKYEDLLTVVETTIEEQEESITLADAIVWKNQNRKEDGGEADGSLTGARWTAARDATSALKTFQHSMRRLRS